MFPGYIPLGFATIAGLVLGLSVRSIESAALTAFFVVLFLLIASRRGA